MEKLYGKQLEIMATKARLLGLDAVHTAASGHIGGSLSAMDKTSVIRILENLISFIVSRLFNI